MHPTVPATLALACCLAAASALGGGSVFEYQQNATGACDGALPAFETSLRRRPTGIRNEGASVAFVSCSLMNLNDNDVAFAGIRMKNAAAGSVEIGCTMVNGRGSFTPTYFPKSVVLAAGAAGFIVWSESDNGGNSYRDLVNFSCALSPGTEIEYTAVGTGAL